MATEEAMREQRIIEYCADDRYIIAVMKADGATRRNER